MRNLCILSVAFALMICGTSFASAQSVVRGVVLDGDKIPIMGANVRIPGTSIGTVSDLDGAYRLTVPESSVVGGESKLLFSFIGFIPQELTVNFSQSKDVELNVIMSLDAEVLGDVVVVGYGTVKKEDATGAITAISSDDFNQGAITAPQDLLTGKTPGVQITNGGGSPNGASTIRIRGGASMSASNDPLIVIDGVPLDTDGLEGMGNPLNSVNPSDIETFTVLKDASATAIYGSRASNGVIIITTKGGKGSEKLSIDYAGKVSVATAAKVADVMNADEFREFVTTLYGADSDAVSILGDTSTDWQDEVIRTSISHDHSLGIKGGIKNLPYRLSLGYTKQNGILENSSLERFTVGLNLHKNLFDNHLMVSANTKYMHVENSFPEGDMLGDAVAFDPTQQIYDSSSPYGGFFTWTDINGDPVSIATMNPVAKRELFSDRSEVDRYILNGKVDYKLHFFPQITATLNLGLDRSTSSGEKVAQATAAWESPTDPERAGTYSPKSQDKTNKTLDFYLTYSETFNQHRVKAMAGYAWQHFKKEGSNVTYNYEQTNEKSAIKYYANQNYLVSYFGRVEYDYNSKYLITGTVRRDGTSRFSEDNRFGLFPAIGAAWKINDEAFMENNEILSDLKLRLGWGITGQQNVVNNDLPYQGNYVLSDNQALYPWQGEYSQTLRPEGYDENIKWEETVTYNGGVDFGLLENRITGSVDLYYRETTDLINTIPIPAGSNLTNELTTNVGNLENKGVEFSINYRSRADRDFSWEMGANFTYNENKITKLTQTDDPSYLGVETGDITGGTGSKVQIHSVDHPTNSFFVYQQVYDEMGKPIEGLYVDQNEDGLINNLDKYQLGQAAPKVMVGLNTSMNYRNWDLSLSGRCQFGASIYNDNKSNNGTTQDVYNSGGNYLTNRLRSARDGFGSTQFWSDYYVEDASFFKLDNATVGYRFTNLKRENLNIRVYATGQNLFVITPYDGIDPEVSSGIDNNIYPRPRVIMMGVNVGF